MNKLGLFANRVDAKTATITALLCVYCRFAP